jgi:hypothetical protein
MSVELAKEIWDELKRYVNSVDRDDAAETLVSVLIDNDCNADDIKETFKSDSFIKSALKHYLKDHQDEEDDDDDDDTSYYTDPDYEDDEDY